MILLDSFRNVPRPYTVFYTHRDSNLNPNSNSATFASANNSDKFLYTLLLLHLIPVARSCHVFFIFSDHLCANFGDESQNDECHTLDIGRPLFIKEMDERGDFR